MEQPRLAAIQYLGQVGFLFRVDGLTVVVDPYLTDSVDRLEAFPRGFWKRTYDPPVQPGQMTGVDLVLCTHDHMDHADPETLGAIASASPGAFFAGPRMTVDVFRRSGIDASRTAVLREGIPFTFRNLTVDSVAASHEEYETDVEGFDRFLGFLLRWDGLTLYHAGDTVLTPRLVNALKSHRIHAAFLPINGRNDNRRRFDVIGNMNPAEAMKLAHVLASGAGLDLVAPTHYDLYPFNGEKLAAFAEAWEAAPPPKPRFKAFLPGEEIYHAY